MLLPEVGLPAAKEGLAPIALAVRLVAIGRMNPRGGSKTLTLLAVLRIGIRAMERMVAIDRDCLFDKSLDRLELSALAPGNEADCSSRLSCTRGAAYAMDIAFTLKRKDRKSVV